MTLDTDKAYAPVLTVDGGTPNAFVNATTAAAVPLTLTGLETGDTGIITFTDSAGHTVPLSVSASQTSYTVNLSSLADGTITSSLLVTDAASNTTTATGNPVTLDQDKVAEPPILKIANISPTVPAGGSIPLGIKVIPVDGDDNVVVTISGVPQGFETITANDGHAPVVQHGANYTFTAADVNAGLTLHSTYGGGGHPVNSLTVTASNTTTGETATSAPQVITVTDPPSTPATASVVESNTGLPGSVTLGQEPSQVDHLAKFLEQFMAAGCNTDQNGASAIAESPVPLAKAGSGDTVLIGGNGDTLVAGHGHDNFLFRPDFGTNTIANFNVHGDTLQFDDAIFHGVRDILAHTTDTAAGAVISDGHGDSVTLLGVTKVQMHMHENDFHLVT